MMKEYFTSNINPSVLSREVYFREDTEPKEITCLRKKSYYSSPPDKLILLKAIMEEFSLVD